MTRSVVAGRVIGVAVVVVGRGVLVKDARQVAFAGDQQPVGALPPDGADPRASGRVFDHYTQFSSPTRLADVHVRQPPSGMPDGGCGPRMVLVA
jgi:hypothetical protein